MRRRLPLRGLAICLVVFAFVLWPCRSARAAPQTGTQLLVVLGQGWDDVHATLQRFERGADGAWHAVAPSVPCVLGRHGLGWGRGTEPMTSIPDEPEKREGDGRSPAGIFRIRRAFGFAPAADAKAWIHLPYTALVASSEWVDDPRSKYYNHLVDSRRVRKDWTSAEHMARISVYRYGAFIEHNAAPPLPGKGSCIFLHIWHDADSGTAGCTALDENELKKVLGWLRPEEGPLLVQMPRQVYARMRDAHGWP